MVETTGEGLGGSGADEDVGATLIDEEMAERRACVRSLSTY